jgi:hypothetical protein
MVESIYGQDFTYTREVEEEMAKKVVKLGQKTTEERHRWLNQILSIQFQSRVWNCFTLIFSVPCG